MVLHYKIYPIVPVFLKASQRLHKFIEAMFELMECSGMR